MPEERACRRASPSAPWRFLTPPWRRPDLRRFLQLASDWDAPLVRVFGGDLDPPPGAMLGLLTAGGYSHWISMEWEKRWHPEIEDPEVALPQHLDLLTAWLESGL